MREKMLVPAVLLVCASLMIGASFIAARSGPEDEGGVAAAEGLPESVEEAEVGAEAEAAAPVDEEMLFGIAAPDLTEVALEEDGESTIGIEDGSESGKAEEGLSQNETLISLHVDDVELQEVVDLFIRIAEANIMYTATNLRGTVSVHLQDVEWKPALDAILEQKQLMLKDNGTGVYSIVNKGSAPEPLNVDTIFLKYAKVSEVIGTLKDSIGPRGKISNFASRNAIVVRATQKDLTDLKKLLDTIDIPRGQVYIEAKFMELGDVAIKNMGVNWQMLQGYELSGSAALLNRTENLEYGRTKAGSLDKSETRARDDARTASYADMFNGTFIPNRVNPVPGTRTVGEDMGRALSASEAMSDTFSQSFSDVRTAVLSPLSFNLILSALKQQAGVSVVSNPRILVANSQDAVIHIGENRTPLIPKTATVDGALKTTYEPGSSIESGVKLAVTPTINTMSNITVEIEPNITRILSEAEWTTAPDGSKYPATAEKTISTIFTLFSGETAAIGGLTETRDEDIGTKIPILGDIPLIGKYLFSHTKKEKRQTETIIFVTVGLANHERLEEDVGMPGDARLAHGRMIKEATDKRKQNQELVQMRNAAREQEERQERRKRFLLQRTR